jgi:hypothetical protein
MALWCVAAALGLLWGAPPVGDAGEGDIAIKAIESWSGVFGGARATLHFTISARRAFRGSLGWSLAHEQRTLLRREQPVALEPGRPQRLAVRLDVPPVKEGVVMDTMLSVAVLTPEGGGRASLEKRLWVFPRSPFADRAKWLRDLKIRLFDPVRRTREVLEAAKVPFETAANQEALAAAADGLIVVGEGVSFDDYRGLAEILNRTAAKGIPVLCLAPAGGQMSLPGSESADLPAPSRVGLRRSDVIRDLDKRLDDTGWPPNGKLVARTLTLKSHRQRVVAVVTDGGEGWPWLDVRYAGKRGRLIVCCFPIIARWETGPTPRFLFARMLELLSAEERRVQQ